MLENRRTVAPVVFLPPVAEELPDLAFWTPTDKHLVLRFQPPPATGVTDSTMRQEYV